MILAYDHFIFVKHLPDAPAGRASMIPAFPPFSVYQLQNIIEKFIVYFNL
jgi:hypothetical protein